MAQYSRSDFNSMRQDAIRRSREMQRHAASPIYNEKSAHPEGADLPPHTSAQSSPPRQPQFQLPAELQGLLKDWDGERLALLALLYLLYREGADPRLLLAIGYILL